MNKLKTTLALLFIGLFSVSPVSADVAGDPPKLPEIAGILDKVMGYVFPIGGLIAVIFVIIGGYMWIVSSGDPSKVKQAQGTLTWAIFGLVFLLVIFAVLKVLVAFVTS